MKGAKLAREPLNNLPSCKILQSMSETPYPVHRIGEIDFDPCRRLIDMPTSRKFDIVSSGFKALRTSLLDVALIVHFRQKEDGRDSSRERIRSKYRDRYCKRHMSVYGSFTGRA